MCVCACVCEREREFLSEKYIERDERAHTSNEITETEQKVIVLESVF